MTSAAFLTLDRDLPREGSGAARREVAAWRRCPDQIARLLSVVAPS